MAACHYQAGNWRGDSSLFLTLPPSFPGSSGISVSDLRRIHAAFAMRIQWYFLYLPDKTPFFVTAFCNSFEACPLCLPPYLPPKSKTQSLSVRCWIGWLILRSDSSTLFDETLSGTQSRLLMCLEGIHHTYLLAGLITTCWQWFSKEFTTTHWLTLRTFSVHLKLTTHTDRWYCWDAYKHTRICYFDSFRWWFDEKQCAVMTKLRQLSDREWKR